MNEGSRWYIAALALGVISASLSGWLIGIVWRDSTLPDYARVMGLTFLGGLGVGAILYELPAWWMLLWQQVRDMERLRLEAARFRNERNHLVFNAPATFAAGEPITVNAYEREWRKFYVDSILFCIRKLNGDPIYKSGLDAIMEYADWRYRWAAPLVREGMLSPVYQGNRTRWADGWSAQRLLGKLEANWLPPCPNEPPPSLKL